MSRSTRIALATLALLAFGSAPREVDAKGKGSCQYTVEKGDTVSRIARRNGVSEANLIKANTALRKNPDRLRVGQTLEICKAKRIESHKPQKCGNSGRLVSHKVGRGETLGAIAARYSVSRDSIRRYNKRLKGRDNSMIRAGETLKVCTTLRRYTHRSWFSGGVQLPEGDGYHVRRPDNAWGTPAAVASITAAIGRYRELEPDAPLVQIGDISRKNGGPLREHVSHQEGRDVDIGYVWDEPVEGEEDARRTMNLARTWTLLRTFANDEDVNVIFIDYKLQKRLYEYALAIGEDPVRLDEIFEYPRSHDDEAIFYHWPGHADHFHVRFVRSKGDPDEGEDDADADADAADTDPDAPSIEGAPEA